MKKILIALLIGVSSASFAAVAPTNAGAPRRVGVVRPDATKMKMEIKKPVADVQKETEDMVRDAQRYSGVLTVDNVQAIDNMSALMQDNPEKLFKDVYGADFEDLGVTYTKEPGAQATFVRTIETDDAGAKFASLNTPDITGTYTMTHDMEADYKAMHKRALKQIEEIGHKHLGQKQVAIEQPTSPEELRKMLQEYGIDPKQYPELFREPASPEEIQKMMKVHGVDPKQIPALSK